MTRGIYVTGTDTGIGKTFASCALLHSLRNEGLRAVGMKPVASGCERTDEGWRNDDALRLLAASDPQPDYALVNPYALPAPTAPELAAHDVGLEVLLPPLRVAFDALEASADVVVVEGVGGWATPLSHTLDQCDLVHALELPVVLVVGLRLGCINHARLTARAIQVDGLQLLGWIGSAIDPEFARSVEAVAILDRCIPAPRLGLLPHRPETIAAQSVDQLRDAVIRIRDFRHTANPSGR
jgi:dethiobiotin synthetase